MQNTIEVQQTSPVQYQAAPNQQQVQYVIHNYPQNPQVLVSPFGWCEMCNTASVCDRIGNKKKTDGIVLHQICSRFFFIFNRM